MTMPAPVTMPDGFDAAKLFAGDAGALAAFNKATHAAAGVAEKPPSEAGDLFAADAHERLPLVNWSTDGVMSDPEKLRHIKGFRELGFSDDRIKEMMDEGRAYTPQIRAAAEEKWRELTSNPEFVRKVLDGDRWAGDKLAAYSTIMSGNIKEGTTP